MSIFLKGKLNLKIPKKQVNNFKLHVRLFPYLEMQFKYTFDFGMRFKRIRHYKTGDETKNTKHIAKRTHDGVVFNR